MSNISTANSFAIWITGIPGSGKTTLASMLAKKLSSNNIPCQILESDAMRKIITPKPTYTNGERENFYSALIEIGKMFLSHGINVIFDATANRKKFRENARNQIPHFMEVYLLCPVELARSRDTKGLYRLANSGRITTLPGIQADYEPPDNPEIIIHSERENPEEEVERIYKKIKELFLIKT